MGDSARTAQSGAHDREDDPKWTSGRRGTACHHRSGKLLALDTPGALKAKAPGGTLIELVLDGDAMPAAEIAETINGVSRVEANDGVLRVHSSRGGELLPALIEAAESAGRAVKDIHLLQPSLETLFVSLTGRKLG